MEGEHMPALRVQKGTWSIWQSRELHCARVLTPSQCASFVLLMLGRAVEPHLQHSDLALEAGHKVGPGCFAVSPLCQTLCQPDRIGIWVGKLTQMK